MPLALLERFINAKKAAGCTQNTLRWYRMCVAHYLDWVEVRNLEYKKPDTVESYLVGLRVSRLASSTVSGYYTALASWFNWLNKRNLLDENPMDHTPKPKVIKKVKRRVRPEEFRRLYASIGTEKWIDRRDRCLLLILFYSGLRLTELLNLRPTDVDIEERLIQVECGKGEKPRLVPCHPDLVVEMPAYFELRPPFGSEFLFVADDGHGRVRGQLSVGGLRTILARRFTNAGLKPYNPHAFRHAFAMEFLNNGMELSAVSAAMGHASVKTTQNEYAEWITAGLKREYNDALRRTPPPR